MSYLTILIPSLNKSNYEYNLLYKLHFQITDYLKNID